MMRIPELNYNTQGYMCIYRNVYTLVIRANMFMEQGLVVHKFWLFLMTILHQLSHLPFYVYFM